MKINIAWSTHSKMANLLNALSALTSKYYAPIAIGIMVPFIGINMAREAMTAVKDNRTTFIACGNIIACGILSAFPAFMFGVAWPITIPYTAFYLYEHKHLPWD